jgi:carbon starvation protein
MKKLLAALLWIAVAAAGAWAYVTLARHSGESINSIYILIAAICTYTISYRFYSKWLAARVLGLNDRRATPCEVHDDGRDFVKTNRWIVFGHHFAAIAGPGPLVGPVLAAQFGYLPGTLWILIGVVLGGAVQDFVVLFASIRRDGKSLGQMVKEELNSLAGYIALIAILGIIIILLAVLGLVVVRALAESPWGVFTVGATIPIAMFMGGYMRFVRVGKVLEASAMGVVLLLIAVWGGRHVSMDPNLAAPFTLKAEYLAVALIVYGLAASVLPVWLLLAPRDYLSTFMKLGTIFALAAGVSFVLPDLRMAAITKFVDGSGLVVAGKLFPFCFITIACGSISGFHTLIASGTTPKIITRESYARPIGYGAMCLESLVGIMALIAACTLDPGVYLSMNVKGAGTEPAAIAADTVLKVQNAGFTVSTEQMQRLADEVQEKSLYGRTGGAATLAVGMAQIFSNVTHGRWLGHWYHFAIMFEALFILTTLDAGTRVGRYLLQDMLGSLWKPLGDTRDVRANLLASVLMVSGWGYFLIQGVRDPLGGINSLWPLFGIANQLLAAIALCLATTVILKMQLAQTPNAKIQTPEKFQVPRSKRGKPVFAMVTLIPLIWLLAVTMTAGWQKIFHPDARIGFLSAADALNKSLPDLNEALATAKAGGDAVLITVAEKTLDTNRVLHFNNLLDAFVAGFFLVLVVAIVALSVREWILLLVRRRPARLRESEAVWLPDYAVPEARPAQVLGVIALGCALAKELSGEAHLERAQQAAVKCECEQARSGGIDLLGERKVDCRRNLDQIYVEALEQKHNRVNRCC